MPEPSEKTKRICEAKRICRNCVEIMVDTLGPHRTLHICADIVRQGGHLTEDAASLVFDIAQDTLED